MNSFLFIHVCLVSELLSVSGDSQFEWWCVSRMVFELDFLLLFNCIIGKGIVVIYLLVKFAVWRDAISDDST